MGLAKANEVLIWGKKKEAQELLDCGFLKYDCQPRLADSSYRANKLLSSKILPAQSVEEFHSSVRTLVLSELAGLDPVALLTVKKLIRAGLADKNDPDAVNLRESYAQAERFASGIPAERFMKIATKQIRHKL